MRRCATARQLVERDDELLDPAVADLKTQIVEILPRWYEV
jgi:hypothetical protein